MIERNWARAIKSQLGDVWHIVRTLEDRARCSSRVRLDTSSMKLASRDGPQQVRVCERCQRLATTPERYRVD